MLISSPSFSVYYYESSTDLIGFRSKNPVLYLHVYLAVSRSQLSHTLKFTHIVLCTICFNLERFQESLTFKASLFSHKRPSPPKQCVVEDCRMESISLKVHTPYAFGKTKNGNATLPVTPAEQVKEEAVNINVHPHVSGWFSEYSPLWPGNGFKFLRSSSSCFMFTNMSLQWDSCLCFFRCLLS